MFSNDFKESEFDIDKKRVKDEAEKRREEQAERRREKTLEEQEKDSDKKNQILRKRTLETFQDTDFSKHDFDDLRAIDGRSIFIGAQEWLKVKTDSDKDRGLLRDEDSFAALLIDDYKRKEKQDEMKSYKEFLRKDLPNLHDWVPSDPDPTANGAFTTGADNGSPVPYKLNGWVEVQRGLPWEAH
ncbi:MAG: hypothetical protein K2X27_13205 [Candidatus Obscuribacterales bacterium]|nr:hypothetical protein [Candidatus Obscuribacterales bacterium]